MISILNALCFALSIICKIWSSNGAGLHQGDQCIIQNEKIRGICTSIGNCSWALTRNRQRQHIDKCDYIGKNTTVCCPLDEEFDSGQPSTVSSGQSNNSVLIKMSSASAWSERKCEEYYPIDPILLGSGGIRSLPREFPHMAILGYGNETEKEWKCGGSLISYQHILTAAHCLESTDFGELNYVRLGDLDIQSDTDKAEPQDFNVKLAILHPDFDHSTLKHDIAILVLDKPVRITDYVKPGCLFPGGVIEDDKDVTATGWGITIFAGQPSSHLIKVQLKIIDNTDCRRQYQAAGARGNIDEELQICAGSAHVQKIIDTCEGDSGGPLQYRSFHQRREHYMIFGVTSFGKTACGIIRSAGVYTSVSSHLPWIESIVTNNV